MDKITTKPKISILVPIYNVEKYLSQCLDSLVKQTLKEIEIICINDGSTDNSLRIIKDYAKKDARIVIINKKNSGYGDSMNQGLKKAQGKYVGILESDDFIELDAYECLYKKAKKFEAEVARAHYFHHYQTKESVHRIARPDQTDRLADPAIEPFIFLEAPAIWSAIYKRDFLKKNKIEFLPTPGASYQDTSFNFKVWAMAHRVVFIDKPFVHYRLDNESSSVNQLDKMEYVSKEYAEIEQYLKEHQLMFSLAGIMEWVKFRTYFWNLQRLTPKLAEKFIETARKEFSQAEAEGSLQKIYFGKKDKIAYQALMTLPSKLVVKSIQIRKKIRRKGE